MEILLWCALFFIFYTYFLYPLLLALIVGKRGLVASTLTEEKMPPISIVIPVYNEADRVVKKIKNIKSLNYNGVIQIIIVSDGSDDNTAALIDNFEDVTFVAYKERAGKPTALKRGVEKAIHDILLLSDVRQTIPSRTIEMLVLRLLQPGMGAVSAELAFLDPINNTAKDVGLYWKYERFIRTKENLIGSVPGVSGALYAVHRDDFSPIPDDTILDDMEIPLLILRKGKRVILEPGAFIYDSAQSDSSGEMARKVRTLAGNFQVFTRNGWLFNPFSNPIWWQFLSHKVFRLLVPYAMVVCLITSFVLNGKVYNVLFFGQLLFYFFALSGLKIRFLRRFRFVSFATLFLELNWAAVLGLARHLFSDLDVRWKKT